MLKVSESSNCCYLSINLCGVFLECTEFKRLLFKNETINSFTLGEPPFVNSTAFCNQRKENNGIASENEFPHVAIIKLQNRFLPRNLHESETKCVGSLISDRHVLTSVYCVSSDRNYKVLVQLGTNNYTYEKDHEAKMSANTYEVEEIDAKYGVSILKLNRKVQFDEHVMPVCLYPSSNFVGDVVLVGWSGDWRECDPTLKKWQVQNKLIEQTRWHLTFSESSIINYRQVRKEPKIFENFVH